ncbi:AAA family ATPase [Castellaniella sp.]|uniref:AAA family ATPase n=1 Tax=Castellaniella sp. TaxID=1955812 RepID=UPI002AFE3D2A|nr:AAA family ATPase [Castellaniella sp.]
MSFGLSGPHRSGKTTLAKAFAEHEDIPLVQTTASGVFARLGLSPSETLSFEKRITVQRHILDAFDAQWGAVAGGVFISDRTPIDMMAYTMVEIGQEPIGASNEAELTRYLKDCRNVLSMRFSTVVLLGSGIPIVDAPGKASLSRPFIDHLSMVIDGLCVMPGITPAVFRIDPSETGLAERVQALSEIIDDQFAAQESGAKDAAKLLGAPLTFH